ncbi:GNAT family N-acetyltransferase [Candidatus Poribacteria bacterium]|jgi:RimJ/RimL family protein N-acetyltransferase|nr:GNAT family N-acetyltransferase [Candidatus Poribacteria bacterium]MBT5535456.1 GNAT family N-acetyltransferase [Candidatus Poribacteria bacterium]MBT5713349.1 GNAT family N-acetyltransferase [Candidatus Poribacteria bacterium]MBT7096861.1 GNAT family N-acetyltransferase [Candidatus Poribacteria bacterium]MBT7804684.1 GNAT family N-acetyltransferase [Candidatus Poribacteria bacterium]
MTDVMLPPDQLLMDGLAIRSYDVGDGAAHAEAVTASYDHLKEYMEWAKPRQGVAESELLCRRFRAQYLLRQDFVLGVFDRRAASLVGGTGFHLRGRPLATQYAEVGMWIHAQHAGCGLGTRVLVALLRWGFTEWPWERIEWRCDEDNAASVRVAEKAGMPLEARLRNDATPTGRRRNTLIYAAQRSEWSPGTRLAGPLP